MTRLLFAAALLLVCAAAAAASALPGQVVRQEATTLPPTTVPAVSAATVTSGDVATTVVGSTTVAADASFDDDDEDASAEPTDEEASAEPTDEDDDGVCFPRDATVELQSGKVVPMHAVSIGDSVRVGANEFSTVFMFTHKLDEVAYNYVTLRTASGATLSLTKGHYLYANGALVAAGSVVKGDVLTLGDGGLSTVVEIGSRTGHGLFNPQTLHGDVVVNGIVSSTYTTAVAPAFAHAVLAPLRALSGLGIRFTGLESGAQTLVGVVPGAKVLS